MVGLRVFSTEIGPNGTDEVVDLVDARADDPRAPRPTWPTPSSGLFPTNGTPLYTATQDAYDDAVSTATTRPASTPWCCSATA